MLENCSDLKKLEFLRIKLDTRMAKKLQVKSVSPYYSKVMGKVTVSEK